MASAKGRGRRVVLCQEQDRAVTNSVTSDDQQGRILEVLTRLEGKLDALVRQQAELVREQGALVRGQAAVTRGQAAITELRVIQNLPAGLCGCKRARITTAAQLDKLLGPGTAAAVERELLGSAERCYLALRALLWAAARELDRVSKQASAKEAAGQVATEVESLKEELLSAAAAECNPDPDVVWDFLQRTQDVLVAAGGLKETQDEDCRQQGLSQRLNAAFVLVRRVGELGARGASGPRGEAAQP
ncbi:hypothetical protein CHLRE_01g045825v5 [Chlamydomonas reinhardtii]|uniref:Uncharacterized protein n=1 Tax=Chlamydomonas reinhardtii TaxID=3055 RepID=A0A2K3E7R3_CHLRE|nr:uncharacterized protein CHLRE_01g045825v5 [Chlamydomonas reinhardtii]PNW88821.1 hypothetical protein CHLRE_01g045825v5 [Chlamydomonas reinhardtii]